METKEINKTKILVKVHEPLIAILQHKIESACLKRDAYLDKALRIEARYLRQEVKTPNSDKAKNFIAAQLSELKLKPLNLLLSTETVDLINEVCKEKNVPRDAFMNRFFLLLIASDAVLTALFYDLLEEENARYEIYDWYWKPRGVQDYNAGRDFSFYDLDLNSEGERSRTGNIEIEHNFTYHQIGILDSIERIVTAYTPFMQIRAFIDGITKDMEAYSNYHGAMYSYPFKKDALQKLPDEYGIFKTISTLGFNTFMTDEQVAEQETLDATLHNEMSKDKFLACMLKEKQQNAERAKQARLTKKTEVKAEGEVK
ncbi:MAG: hypothetical protein WCK96_01395 [Methylococcales bacterium]